MRKNAGTSTDDNILYFEPNGAVVEWYVLGISPDVRFQIASSFTETI